MLVDEAETKEVIQQSAMTDGFLELDARKGDHNDDSSTDLRRQVASRRIRPPLHMFVDPISAFFHPVTEFSLCHLSSRKYKSRRLFLE